MNNSSVLAAIQTEEYYCPSAEQAFTNDLILDHIVKHLTELEDLKSFRLINTKCNLVSIKKIMKVSFISQSQLVKKASCYCLDLNCSSKLDAFAEMCEVIDLSPNFPCTSLKATAFWNIGKYWAEDSFLSSFRPLITRLHLTSDFRGSVDQIQYLLSAFADTLIELILNDGFTFGCFDPFWESHWESRPLKAVFKNLKFLTVDVAMTIIKRVLIRNIIQNTPNLAYLGDFDIELFDLLVLVGKTHLIRSIRYTPTAGNIRKYSRLADLKLPLEEIIIPMYVGVNFSANYDLDAKPILTQLLANSKNSLKILKNARIYLTSDTPTLTQITKISLNEICPGDLLGPDNLPNLKIVVIEEPISSQRSADEMLLSCDVFPRVKVLEFNVIKVYKAFMERICEKFPNVERVKVNWETVRTGTEFFWILPEKTSKVEFINFSIHKYRNLLFESFLTGIPRKVCKFVQNLQKDAIHLKTLATLTSVRLLPNLKEVKFYCLDFAHQFGADEFGYFSNLTKWFVLEEMPMLRIHLAFPQYLFFGGKVSNLTKIKFPTFPPVTSDIDISYYDVS